MPDELLSRSSLALIGGWGVFNFYWNERMPILHYSAGLLTIRRNIILKYEIPLHDIDHIDFDDETVTFHSREEKSWSIARSRVKEESFSDFIRALEIHI